MADPGEYFSGCPALASGLAPFSAVKLPLRRVWHPTMHAWCTPAAKACVLAVLTAELRVDRQEHRRLPSLSQELWLLIMECVCHETSWGRRSSGTNSMTSSHSAWACSLQREVGTGRTAGRGAAP